MRARWDVQLGLALLCTSLVLVAATVPLQNARDAHSAVPVNGFAAARAATSAVDDTAVAPAGIATTPPASGAKPEVRGAMTAAGVSSATASARAKTPAVPTATRHMEVASEARVGGDTCADAFVITAIPFTDSGNTCSYSNNYDEVCPYTGSTAADVVYAYTPAVNEVLEITLCVGPTAYDSKLYVYEDTCPGLVMGCNDDSCSSPAYSSWVSRLASVAVSAGHTYYIVVDGYGSSCGQYYIDVLPGAPVPTCPEGSLFGQRPALPEDAWGAYTSAVTSAFDYTVYENFSGVTEQIGDVHWWGLPLYFDPYYGWSPCDVSNLTFEIKFYQDAGGMPGAQTAAYMVTPTAVDTGYNYAGYEMYYFSVDLVPCSLQSDGWISIKSLINSADCAFLWMNSPVGDFVSYQASGGTLNPLGDNLAFCLTGGECPPVYGACCLDWIPECTDNVLGTDCLALGGRFAMDTLCADLSPACGQLTGACCHPDGTCDITTQAECADNWLGPYTVCSQCPCIVICPPNSVEEPEPCGADTDGGCNAVPVAFAPIECGQTVCGSAWADTQLRDTDWYQLTTTGDTIFTWTAEAEFPVLIFIIAGAGPDDCSSYSIIASASAAECTPVTIATGCVPAGTYWFWVGPSEWGNYPCTLDYYATLTCEPCYLPKGACCLPAGTCVPNQTIEQCTNLGGLWQGDLVPCDPNPCVPFYCPAGALYCDEYISRVQLETIDNPSYCGSGQYEDYTYLVADVAYGAGSLLTVTNGNPIWTGDICAVWVDWNQDLDFYDAGELIGTVNGVGPYNFTITPPMTATPGPTRLRIRIDYANSNPSPCGTTTYGEVEDYTVNVREVEGACCHLDDTCSNELPSNCDGFWGGPFTTCSFLDCNGNLVDDYCDILYGVSDDCNLNGIPDECEPFIDCNGNGILDECDILSGYSQDCNDNGIPDECDIADCQGELWCADCNSNGIPDGCELGGFGPRYTYQLDDGVGEDSIGLTAGGYVVWMNHFTVAPNAGKITAVNIAWGMVPDGTPATVYVWSDPNQDGNPTDGQVLAQADTAVVNSDTDTFNLVDIPDVTVGGDGTHFFVGVIIGTVAGEYPARIDMTASQGQSWVAGDSVNPPDPNNLGACELPPGVIDSYGLPGNWMVRAEGGAGGADCNQNGIPDDCDVPPICQGPDCSQDCNSNLIPDECEVDCNGNGRPDDCDIASGTSLDCNLDGIPDECQLEGNDCNGNLIPDDCDIANGTSQDCNENAIPDECDIASGASQDCQPDGIPDECQIWSKDRDILLWDDGTSENSVGLTAGGAFAWVNHFTVTDPGTIQAIQTCFGSPSYPGSSGATPGASFGVYVWSDPNGDGNPLDAVLLAQATGTIEAGSIDTDVFQSVPISVQVSGSFFVGASFQHAAGKYPGPLDQTVPQGQSWVTFNSTPYDPNFWDPANTYNMDAIGLPGNWLLRAEISFGAPPNDCNENGIPDECDIGTQWGGYCTGPECSSDWNGNGVPDECELCGDLDEDGDVDLDDYWAFLDAFGTCVGDVKYNPAADMDGDNCITLVDYRAWRMCYRMANGTIFVVPKPTPVPNVAPVQNPTPVIR